MTGAERRSSGIATTWLREHEDAVADDLHGFLEALAVSAAAYQPFAGEVHRSLVAWCARGRGLGAAFFLATVRGLGGDAEWRPAIRIATSIELLAKSTLLADDIVDVDRTRSGRPSFHAEYEDKATAARWREPERVGRSVALLAAGILMSAAYAALASANLPSSLASRLVEILAGGQMRVDQSQLVDLAFENATPTTAEWEAMARQRAAAHLGACVNAGAHVAGAAGARADALAQAAECVGILYDIRADLLDTFGPATPRREIGRDVRMRKKPLFICAALERAASERAGLLTLLQASPPPLGAIRAAAARLGVPWVLERVRVYERRAYASLEESGLTGDVRRFFEEMIIRAARAPSSVTSDREA